MRHIKENVIEKEQNSISLRSLIKLKQNMDLSLGITKMVFKKKKYLLPLQIAVIQQFVLVPK